MSHVNTLDDCNQYLHILGKNELAKNNVATQNEDVARMTLQMTIDMLSHRHLCEFAALTSIPLLPRNKKKRHIIFENAFKKLREYDHDQLDPPPSSPDNDPPRSPSPSPASSDPTLDVSFVELEDSHITNSNEVVMSSSYCRIM